MGDGTTADSLVRVMVYLLSEDRTSGERLPLSYLGWLGSALVYLKRAASEEERLAGKEEAEKEAEGPPTTLLDALDEELGLSPEKRGLLTALVTPLLRDLRDAILEAARTEEGLDISKAEVFLKRLAAWIRIGGRMELFKTMREFEEEAVTRQEARDPT